MMDEKDKKYIESLVGSGIPPKLSDYDGDGYPDLFDCDPFDPAKDGWIGDAWARLSSASSRARQATRRIYRPAVTHAMQAASTVHRRVSSISARVQEYRRPGVERAQAIRQRARTAPPKSRLSRIPEAYSDLQREVSRRIPTFGSIAAAGERFSSERPAVQRAYQDIGRQVLILPESTKTIGKETFKFSRGAYKEFQEKPVTIAAHTALFAAAGPVLGSLGRAAAAGRVALAARTPAIAAIPVVGRTLVATGRTSAPAVKITAKYALPAMGALWAGSIAQRVHATPDEMRSEKAGRLFMGEVFPMAAGLTVLPAARAIRPTVAAVKTFPEAGVEQVAKQLYIGKYRMPIGYEKTVSQQLSPSSGKTMLAMESEYRATMGQLKYSHTRFARGQIEGDYFLPTPKSPIQIGKMGTGAEHLMLPSPAPKPTRLYAELSQRYTKAKEIELTGGRTIRWLEAGKRKLEYGVQKPSKYELPDIGVPPGTWGISGRAQLPRYGGGYRSYQADVRTPRPSPMGLSTTEAETLSALTGAPRPKMIPERMYFKDTPASSRYYESTELLSAMRRPPVPEVSAPVITVPKPSPKPHVPKPSVEPMMEPVTAPKPARRPAEFAEPSTYETPWAEPKMKRAPLAEAKRKPLSFAEPEPTRFEFPWAEPTLKAAPKLKTSVAQAPAPKRAPKRARTPTPYTAPYRFRDPLGDPYTPPTPTPGKRAYPAPSIYPVPAPVPSPKPSPDKRAHPVPSIYPAPVPAPYPAPKPLPAPSPDPTPKTGTPTKRPPARIPPRIPPRAPIVPPPPVSPPPPYIPFPMDSGSSGARAPGSKRKRAWKQKHELATLADLLGYKP